MKSEKHFFEDLKKEKISAMSMRSSRDSFVQSRPASMMEGFRPDCELPRLSSLPPRLYTRRAHSDAAYAAPAYSQSGHDHDMGGEHYGDHYEGENGPETPMTRLQIFMSRSVAGWPLYTIIISFGQLLSAVSRSVSV